jgi:phosphopantetheinyl transferase
VVVISVAVSCNPPIDAATAWGMLDDDGRGAVLRLKRPSDRRRAMCAHAWARQRLGRSDWVRDARGKPHLVDGPAFSLSHSGGTVALAWSADVVTVGVDVERIDSPLDPAAAALVLSPEEIDSSIGQIGLVIAWTRKEALAKAIGTGLTDELRSVTVRDGTAAGFRIQSFVAPPLVVSVAAPGGWRHCWVTADGPSAWSLVP